MDPNETLRLIRKAMADWREAETPHAEFAAACDGIKAFEALDAWLSRGGFKPADWDR